MSGRRECWCGRPIDDPNEVECAEHDGPIPAVAMAPSDPLTPGGVFGDRPVRPGMTNRQAFVLSARERGLTW